MNVLSMFPEIEPVVAAIVHQGGIPLACGGAVRDIVQGMKPKDLDIEVHGMDLESLRNELSAFGRVKETGVRFAVVKAVIGGREFDFSLPRIDNGAGRNNFSVTVDPDMTFRQAAARRDFTINAMMINLATGELIDPFGGGNDLTLGVLRPTSDLFADDPLRIVRGVQFASRFKLKAAADEDSQRRFRQCVTGEGRERLLTLFGTDPMRAEAIKWFSAPHPDFGFQFMKDSGLVDVFSEVAALIGCPQDSRWHPEGDVFTHTTQVVTVAAALIHDKDIPVEQGMKIIAGAICHDFGKPECTVIHPDGAITSESHAVAGFKPTTSFLSKLGFSHEFIAGVTPLVVEHMAHLSLNKQTNLPRFVRRLATRVRISDLAIVVTADMSGRLAPNMTFTVLQHPWIVAIEQEAERQSIQDRKPEPLVMGRHLIERGMKHGHDGVSFSAILEILFDMQLDGEFATIEDGVKRIDDAVKLAGNRS